MNKGFGNKSKEEISEDFAVMILKLEKDLRIIKHERIASYQIGKSGTSIGANIAESVYAESNEDLIHKLSISQKEAYETLYWLRVLYRSEYIDKETFDKYNPICESLLRIISTSIVTLKSKK